MAADGWASSDGVAAPWWWLCGGLGGRLLSGRDSFRVLAQGKGTRYQPGNYRGISLLFIPGKVYASILLHRVGKQVEIQPSEAKRGFRRGRNTVDAIYAWRALRAWGVYNTRLAMAYSVLRLN